MDLKVQKRLAAQILHCSPKRIIFDNNRLEDIKQAITKRDLRLLAGDKAITMIPARGVSRVRARKIQIQKAKGRRKGAGSRKGRANTHTHERETWRNRIRVQREFLKLLVTKQIIDKKTYRDLYLKSKGAYFRSIRHIKLYLTEHELIKNPATQEKIATSEKAVPNKTKKIIKQ